MMTDEKLLEILENKLARLEAAEACRNLMGKYSYYHTAFRNNEYIDLWAKRDDDLLVMPWGSYHGFEGVRACYLSDHGDRSDPAVYATLGGAVMMHEMDTEVLEVAEDAKTARGCWLSQGHETYVSREGGPTDFGKGEEAHAEWCWGKYQVDFILDADGQWRIWKLRLFPMFKAEYGTSWVAAEQPSPEDYSFVREAEMAASMWTYSPTEIYPANEPEPPLPYRTYSEANLTFEEAGK